MPGWGRLVGEGSERWSGLVGAALREGRIGQKWNFGV